MLFWLRNFDDVFDLRFYIMNKKLRGLVFWLSKLLDICNLLIYVYYIIEK